MPSQQTGRFGTAVSAFITGVVVPVLIQVLANAYKTNFVIHSETPPPLISASISPVARVPAEVKVIAQGVGRSADDAWHDAIHKGLQSLAASLVDGQTWSQSSTLICQQVLQNEKSLILRCEDGRCMPEGGIWHREVVIVVARSTLTDRLKAAHCRVVMDAP